jgi:multidrug efflux pump subunit AcrB
LKREKYHTHKSGPFCSSCHTGSAVGRFYSIKISGWVVIIVLISLATAISLTPMLTAALLGGSTASVRKSRFELSIDFITKGYRRLLGWALTGRYGIIALFLAILVGGGYAATRLGSEFLPQMDDGRVMVKVKLPTGASVTENRPGSKGDRKTDRR